MRIKQLNCLFFTALSLSTAHSADVLLTIKGTISVNTCTVTAGSKEKYVNLGTWGGKQFSNIGIKTLPVPFSIDLEKCNGSLSGVSGANIKFSGNATPGDATAFSLNSTSTAKNIGILILDKNKKIIEPNTDSIVYELSQEQSFFSLLFYGQYISTSTSVIPGNANADITFSITYN